MTTQLNAGKWLGLKRTSTNADVFAILAFDQRGTYRKMLPAGTSYETAVRIKSEIVSALSERASAVLLDNEYGLLPALQMSRHSGLLYSYEKSGYSGDSTYRRIDFDPDWTIAKIKKAGGTAIKLLAYYHPDTGALAEEIEGVIRTVAEDCHRNDLPLFLEPMSYSLKADVAKESADFAATRAKVVIDTARRLSNVGADVLKLEFPIDAAYDSDRAAWQKACEEVSAAATIPWVLLSAGVDFDVFTEQTRMACRSGASGFLAGRAIWKEAVTMTDEQRATFIKEKAVPRLEKLTEIAEAESKPWTKFYDPMTPDPAWFKTY